MADFVSEDANRLYGMGLCPLQSVDAAVDEIAFMAESGLTGMTFRPERYNGMELFSDDMDRVWSAAEDHDMTVAIHGSFGSRMTSFAKTRYSNQFYVHMVCHPFEQMASVMEVVASGILDDHPRLRVGFFESGMGWLPYWLERLDEHKETMGHLVPRPPTGTDRDLQRTVLRHDGGRRGRRVRSDRRRRPRPHRRVGVGLPPL